MTGCPLRLLLLLAAAWLSPSARASEAQPCGPDVVELAGHFLGVADFDAGGDASPVIAFACRPAPDQPGVLLAAFAYTVSPGGKPPPEYEKQLALLVIDRARHRVLASRKEVISEDAVTRVGTDSLLLDTARYLLAPGVRAFGLRFRSAGVGPGCADNTAGELLTLYVPEGRTLRPVLKLDMSAARALAGCVGHGGPASIVESASLTLAMAPTRTQGYADIVVRASIDAWGGDEAKAEDVPKARIETITLHYDGRRYPVAGEWWLNNW